MLRHEEEPFAYKQISRKITIGDIKSYN